MKWLACLVLALICAAIPAASANTGQAPRWESGTVCITNHVPQRWGVKAAIKRWNRVPEAPNFRLARSCPSGGVEVRRSDEPLDWLGATRIFQSSLVTLRQAYVSLDPGQVNLYPRKQRPCMRRHVTSHELGHALGLDHYPNSHAGSAMSYQQWWRNCGRPTAFDRSELARLYR